MSETLYGLIRNVPDFPKPGILFRDITPILLDHGALDEAVRLMAEPLRALGVNRIVAVESRGFILGSPVALALGAGLVLVRKPGKLPVRTLRVEYDLEYGTDALEMHADSLGPRDRVAIVDDVLATGGTAAAASKLVAGGGSMLAAFSFLVELTDLKGRGKLGATPVHSVLRYPRA